MLSKESFVLFFGIVGLIGKIVFYAFFCKRAVLGHRFYLSGIYVIAEMLCHKRVLLIVSGNVRLGQGIVKIEIAVNTVGVGHSIGKIKIVVNSHRAYVRHSAAHKRKLVKLLCTGGIHLCKVVEFLLGSLILILRLGLLSLLLLLLGNVSSGHKGTCAGTYLRSVHIQDSAHSERHSYGIRCEIYVVIIEVVITMLFYLVSKHGELSLRLGFDNRLYSRRLFSVVSFRLIFLKVGELSFGLVALSVVFRLRLVLRCGKYRLFSCGSRCLFLGRGAYLSHVRVFNLICHY